MFRWTQIDALRSLRDVDEKRARRRFGFRDNRPCRSEDGKTTNHQESGCDLQTRLRALQKACADWRCILAGIIESPPPKTAFRDRLTDAGERQSRPAAATMANGRPVPSRLPARSSNARCGRSRCSESQAPAARWSLVAALLLSRWSNDRFCERREARDLPSTRSGGTAFMRCPHPG